jgi:hypothetical protein
VVSAAPHEPEPSGLAAIGPTTLPYATVHDAMIDDWYVVQFPDPRCPFDDEDIDVLGYYRCSDPQRTGGLEALASIPR